MTRLRSKMLYKYRDFSVRTIEQLCSDSLYFADPRTFNDPLDCNPSVEANTDVAELRRLLAEMVQQRVEAEMRSSLDKSRVNGRQAEAHIKRNGRVFAERALAEVAYDATNPEYLRDAPAPEIGLLTNSIERELLRRYERGVCSFASRYDNPLLWSHYGDQHRGLCIGYISTRQAAPNLFAVAYGGSRVVRTSAIAAMVLENDAAARSAVDAAVLLRKATSWRYEREWRLLGPQGSRESCLELAEVVFGLRCSGALVHAVTRALDGRSRAVAFYEMYETNGAFRLKRKRVEEDESASHFPHRALSVQEMFDDLD